MERFIHQQKLASYRRLIAESNLAVTKNQVQHRWLLKLLADEEAKDIEPPDVIINLRPTSFAGALLSVSASQCETAAPTPESDRRVDRRGSLNNLRS
jgi:hypothetical protein